MVAMRGQERVEGTPSAASMHTRILVAATNLTTDSGWSSVTMARLAEVVGVSRQTVYNEVGSKSALAEAMILGELARFLEVVATAFGRHPDDLVDAIRSACRGVLDLAADNTLLKAVVSATHGADTELLPLLTTHAEPLMMTAKAVIAEQLVPYELPLGSRQLEAAIDVVVRVVLSHVMAPSNTPASTADDIAWIAAKVLNGSDG
jgi:AcrR family transcriptional regulator